MSQHVSSQKRTWVKGKVLGEDLILPCTEIALVHASVLWHGLNMTIHQVQIQVDQLSKYGTFIHISCSIQHPGSGYKFLAPLSKGKQLVYYIVFCEAVVAQWEISFTP